MSIAKRSQAQKLARTDIPGNLSKEHTYDGRHAEKVPWQIF